MKNIITLIIIINISLQAQDITNKLGGDTKSETYDVINSSGTLLFRVQGDGGALFVNNAISGAIPMEGIGDRLMWYPAKSALRAGYVDGTQWDDANIGNYSMALGQNTIASGLNSVSIGNSNTAEGNYSTALGQLTKSSGNQSTALNYYTNASGQASLASGYLTDATGSISTAMGYNGTASGNTSTSLGFETTASGDNSTAMGLGTTASGESSTAMGYHATASGGAATAMGSTTTASGLASTAMGQYTTANGQSSTALGNFVSTHGHGGSFIIGDNSGSPFDITTSSADNEMTMIFTGGYRLLTNDAANVGVSLAGSGSSWTTISDSTKKENFKEADGEYFLNSINKLKLGSWNYKAQDSSIRHYGPMAQEIYHYFGKDDFGTIGNDTTLATADMDGIMMIAIKALESRTKSLKNENAELRNEIAGLKSIVNEYLMSKD